MPLPSPHGLRVVAALGAVYLVWGSTYAALGAMVETVPPWLGAGSRFLLAGGCCSARSRCAAARAPCASIAASSPRAR